MAVEKQIRTEGKLTVPPGETSNAIEFHDDVAIVIVTVSFLGGVGEGKIQTTMSTDDDLLNGTPIWIDWPEGIVTVITQDWAHAPNALRAINSGGTNMLVEIRGNYA